MKVKDDNQGIPKSTSGTKPEITKPEQAFLQPLPPVKPKFKNFMPDILEIRFEPSSCTESIACSGFGGEANFELDFKLYREDYEEHLIKIGLKRGKLKLNLEPLQKKWLKPKTRIPPTATIREEVKNSFEIKPSIKQTPFSKEKTKSQTFNSTFIRISTGGTPERPYWYFEAVEGHFLEGTAEDLLCKITPAEEFCCNCKYEFIVEPGSWSFEFSVDQKLGKLNLLFAKLKMKELAKRRIIQFNYNAEQLYYVLSRGKWKCPANKRIHSSKKK